MAWLSESDPPDAFPDIESALREPDGLLAAGGDLSRERLLAAYPAGVFPWYDDGQPILWWSPDPRCVLFCEDFRQTSRFRRYLRQSTLTLTYNRAFDQVMRACAGRRRSEQGTWITPAMMSAYEDLHESGWAHSVEIWASNRLVGGIYGIGIGRIFFGESMFSHEDNASKFALYALTIELLRHDCPMIDCQVVSEHLLTLGATTIPRSEFRVQLNSACRPAKVMDFWPGDEIPIAKFSVE
ncbi:MAG: leucyl/phenylalanyl-tRNA--protein transferase [Gammaproteobacteria bacterium]|nr:leucyl/phenylalanyl-tRNA--protein transferase [Gammaproteobacteria bacterium]